MGYTNHLIEFKVLSSAPAPNKRKAFALIIALALMSLIVLMILAFSSVAKTGIQITESNTLQTLAKKNALLALNKAIGQLQLNAGPDQRVTARADILEHSSSPHTSKTYWTGVWDSNPDSPNFGKRISWLTSSATPSANPDEDNSHKNPLNSNPVTLLGNSTAFNHSKYKDLKIKIDPSNITNANGDIVGQYAYWIGDEAIKHNAAYISDNWVQRDSYMNELSPSKTGVTAISNLSSLPLDEKLSKVMTLNQLNHLDPQLQSSIQIAIHDITTHSLGLFTNVREGGLQKDLTAGLQSNSSAIETFTGTTQVFSGNNPSSPSDTGGPRWSQLRSYFNLPNSSEFSGKNESITVSPRRQTPNQMGVYPIVSQFELWYYPTVVTDATHKWVRMNMFPVVVLWNPYNTTLEGRSYYCRFGAQSDGQGSRRNSQKLHPQCGYHNGTSWQVGFDTGDGSTYSQLESFAFQVNCPSIPPGEAYIFSPATSTLYNRNNPELNILEIGYRPEKYIYEESDTKINVGIPMDRIRSYKENAQYREFAIALDATQIDTTPIQTHGGLHANYPAYRSIQQGGLYNYPATTAPDIEATNANFPTPPCMGYRYASYRPNLNIQSDVMETKYIAHYNVRCRASHRSPKDIFAPNGQRGYQTSRSFRGDYTTTATDYGKFNNLGNNAYVGYSNQAYGGLSLAAGTRAILFHIPRSQSEINSIGSLTHAHLTSPNETVEDIYENYRFDSWQPTYPIGNSLAHPITGFDKIYNNTWPGTQSMSWLNDPDAAVYDWSYSLNDALWDRFFFSTVPSSGDIPKELDDPRKQHRNLNKIDPTKLRDFDKAASELLLNGGFNINSTSINAWKAFLSSLRDAPVTYKDQSAKTHIEENENETPFIRFPYPYVGKIDPEFDDYESEALYAGFRSLSEDEVNRLANQIVAQVKDRGPFLSLADFVNRSIQSSDKTEHKLSGALQSAIDNTNINEAVALNLDQSHFSGSEWIHYDTEILSGNQLLGTPGTLTQADILQRLGNSIQARSDTFRIRAYGDVTNPITQKKKSKTWCEAIVQRTPDYVDTSYSSEDAPDDTNQKFGRSFKIVFFRWLTEEQI